MTSQISTKEDEKKKLRKKGKGEEPIVMDPDDGKGSKKRRPGKKDANAVSRMGPLWLIDEDYTLLWVYLICYLLLYIYGSFNSVLCVYRYSNTSVIYLTTGCTTVYASRHCELAIGGRYCQS